MSLTVEEGTRTTGTPPEGADVVLNSSTPETTTAIVQLLLDINALAAGDTLEVAMKEKVISGGTQRIIHRFTIVNSSGADDAVWVSPAVFLKNGWDMTLKQTAGSSRAIPWSIRKVT